MYDTPSITAGLLPPPAHADRRAARPAAWPSWRCMTRSATATTRARAGRRSAFCRSRSLATLPFAGACARRRSAAARPARRRPARIEEGLANIARRPEPRRRGPPARALRRATSWASFGAFRALVLHRASSRSLAGAVPARRARRLRLPPRHRPRDRRRALAGRLRAALHLLPADRRLLRSTLGSLWIRCRAPPPASVASSS